MDTTTRARRGLSRAGAATLLRAALILTLASVAAPMPAAAQDGALPAALLLRPTAVGRAAGPGIPIDTFQYDTPFVKQTTAGSVEADLTQTLIGTRSLRLSTDGDGLQVNLRATNLRPVDLSGSFLTLTLKLGGLEHLRYLSLYLSTDGFETYDSFPVLTGVADPAATYADDGAWFTITAGLGTTASGAAPAIDLSSVTDIQLSIADDGAGPVTAWFDYLGAVPLPPRGKVSLVFDDARDGAFDFALPLAQRLGIRASIAAIVDLVGVDTFMTVDQLLTAERFGGWEVIAHQTSLLEDGGFDTLSPEALEAELAGVKAWLLENGFERGVDVIAYPYGGYDEASLKLIRRYFAAGRTIDRSQGLETWPPADPYRIRALSLLPSDTPDAINALIDRAARERAWLVLVFHQVYPRGSDFETYYYMEDLASILAHLAAADVDVVLLSEALGAD